MSVLKPRINNELYFEMMPKILDALKESIETISQHALKDSQCRYAESLICIDGVHDRVRYDRRTDTLCVILNISIDENQIGGDFGSGDLCLADPDKIKQVEIPIPSFLIKPID